MAAVGGDSMADDERGVVPVALCTDVLEVVFTDLLTTPGGGVKDVTRLKVVCTEFAGVVEASPRLKSEIKTAKARATAKLRCKALADLLAAQLALYTKEELIAIANGNWPAGQPGALGSGGSAKVRAAARATWPQAQRDADEAGCFFAGYALGASLLQP